MRMFIKDIHRSLRTLAKRPAFFVVAPLTPSLGIGANTTLFSVVHAVVWRQLPFRHTDGTFWTKRIVQVYYRFIRKRRPARTAYRHHCYFKRSEPHAQIDAPG